MDRGVMIAAHRGTSGANIIQNTIGAYENALLHGADILEMDVIDVYKRQVLNSDYIKTARSKGIPEWKVYLKHGFRNAMKPVLVILVFRIPMLVGGSVVIESVFSYPGIGLTMTNAIVSGDYPIVLVTTLIIAAAMLICSFMVDVFNALLDPRVRLGE